VNDYADLLLNRFEKSHELVREHLGVTANRMQNWYDRKVNVQHFDVIDEVYVLNLRLYPNKCPKWVRRYSNAGIIRKKINDVTYVVRCDN